MAGMSSGANYGAALRRTVSVERPVEFVQIEGLVSAQTPALDCSTHICFLQVVLKIIKHCQEELTAGATSEVQGALLGLVREGRLEVTNCFPFPRHTEDDDMDEGRANDSSQQSTV